MKKTTTLCFSGHRNLPTGEQLETLTTNLRTAIQTAIDDGYDTFLFGGCYGFDLLVANEILAVKSAYPQVQLHAIIPYEEQANHWTESQRELYFDTMAHCDEVITLQPKFDADCYKKRNQHMIDRSSRLIAYWNGNLRSGTIQTVHMAEKAGMEVQIL